MWAVVGRAPEDSGVVAMLSVILPLPSSWTTAATMSGPPPASPAGSVKIKA